MAAPSQRPESGSKRPKRLPSAACSRIARIEEVNRIYGTDFRLGQVVSYDAGKGRGRRLATITDAEDGFLKLMRDGDSYEYQALWDAVEIHPENDQVMTRPQDSDSKPHH